MPNRGKSGQGRNPLRIEVYGEALRSDWDLFVGRDAINGHFMHQRDFLDYHGDRFEDHSLVFRGRDRIRAVLPAHREEETLASHRGLTFGGLLVDDAFDPGDCESAFSALGRHMSHRGFKRLEYRPGPVWYHRHPFELEQGLLGKAEYLPGAVCAMGERNHFNPTRKNLLQRAGRCGMLVERGADLLPPILSLVARVLEIRHRTVPVHTLAELEVLRARFPEGIQCFASRVPEHASWQAGIILFVAAEAVKLQYVGYTEEAGHSGAMEFLYNHVLTLPEFRDRAFDFGTSVKDGDIDASLMAYKESLGGRLRLVARFHPEAEQLRALSKAKQP